LAQTRAARLLGAAALLLPLSCQALLGDFAVDDAPAAPDVELGVACKPNAFRCTGPELETCASDRRGYTHVETCSDANHCDPTAGGCRACLAGEWACNDAKLESCSPVGEWVTGGDCGSSTLCYVSADRRLGSCDPPSCGAAGAHECRSGLLLRCAEGRDGFRLADRCTSDATCDAAKADAQARMAGSGTCVESLPEPCEDASCETTTCSEPGALRCVTGDLTTLERCGNDGKWAVSAACASSALCSETAGRCLEPACELGETRCLGQARQSCSDDLTRFATDETCASEEQCTPGGCVKGSCTEGTFRCNGPSLEECQAGRWHAEERCATAALCDASVPVCFEPTCGGRLDDFRCTGQSLEQCMPGRTGWADFRYCPGGCRIESGVPICDG